jgi:CheY-like chemotaxis protein
VDQPDPVLGERVAVPGPEGINRCLRGKRAPAMGPARSATAPPTRVLLVDDEGAFRRLFEQFLTGAGYEVQGASDGCEAWALFNDGPVYDVVITDRAMPEMGGEELGRRIKEASPQTPVIMITGNTEAIAAPETFDEILAKPFTASALLASLSRVI